MNLRKIEAGRRQRRFRAVPGGATLVFFTAGEEDAVDDLGVTRNTDVMRGINLFQHDWQVVTEFPTWRSEGLSQGHVVAGLGGVSQGVEPDTQYDQAY